jgi:hypothetical protein
MLRTHKSFSSLVCTCVAIERERERKWMSDVREEKKEVYDALLCFIAQFAHLTAYIRNKSDEKSNCYKFVGLLIAAHRHHDCVCTY